MATKSYLDLGGLTKFWEKAKIYIDNNIEQNKYDDTELAAEVAQNTAAITVLNGEGEGSVKKTAADAVAEIVAGADEKYDTLKEISDFIINDVTGSAGLVNKVTANSNAIQELETTTSILVSNGDGTKYLANDGSYKTVDYAAKADADGAGKNIADTYATKKEIPTKVSQLENDADYLPNTIPFENGVYVVDINGDLHDPNTFTGTSDDVTGIGLVTDNGSWIVALDEWYSNSTSTAWNGNIRSTWGGYGTEVTGCWTGTSGYLNDFDGEANTDAIISQLSGTTDHNSKYYTGAPAAEYCRAYSKGYKDVGSWYLPSAGEFNEIALNKDAIDTILTKLGKDSLSKNPCTWSSSQFNSGYAWYYRWSASVWISNQDGKGMYYGVRPVAKLEAPTITITSRIDSLESSVSELNIKATPADAEIDDVIEYVTATEMEAALARIAELENYVNGLKESIAESIQLANRIIG